MATILFNEIPYSNADLNNPGRGVEQWHNANDVNVPVEGVNTQRHDVYFRFVWTKIEGRTQGSYNWAYFDNLVLGAIARKQTLSFGIMTVFPGNEVEAGGQSFSIGGGYGCYPEYVHNKMQAAQVKDWKLNNSTGTWTPNYNDPFYAERLLALHQAINARVIEKGWEKVIGVIDVRGYGAWGEWHSAYTPNNVVGDYPAGTFPTVASLKKIVDAHTQGFPNFPLVAMIAGFDAQFLQNTWNPAEIAHYLLTTKNQWGPLGWRRDQWGATDAYLESYLVNNTRTFNGVALNTLIMPKWQVAPISGEPPNWNPGDYFDLERQIKLYHATSFGNGNYGVVPNTTIKTRVRSASKICGYRFKVISAIVTVDGSNLNLTLNWQNIGNGNAYQNWDIVFEIVGTNFKAISKHKLKFFQPKTAADAITESFPLTGVPAGTYALRFAVKDPNGYRVNMALAIQGGDADNNYSLGSIQVGATPPPVNQGPVANAGGDIEITLPVNSAQLKGSGADADGVIAAYLWQQVSGPSNSVLSATNVPIIKVSSLLAGVYTYRLTVTDDKGATNSDTVSVKVNAEVIPPPTPKTVVNVTNVSTVIYSDGSTEEFPK